MKFAAFNRNSTKSSEVGGRSPTDRNVVDTLVARPIAYSISRSYNERPGSQRQVDENMQDAYCFAASLRSVLYLGPIVEQLEGVRSRRVDIGAELVQKLLRDSII